MRRHFAKASTAGLTQRQAGHLTPPQGLFGLACLAVLALTALLAGNASSAAAAEECPNETRRQEQGITALRLPDCRAYEVVTPESRIHEAGESTTSTDIRVSADGDAVGYESVYPAPREEHSGKYYLSRRSTGGWTTKNIVPQQSTETIGRYECAQEVLFSADLTKNVFAQDFRLYTGEPGAQWYPEGFCNDSEEVLDPREPRGVHSLFVHDLSADAYELVSLNEVEGAPGNSYYRAGSQDLSTIIFESEGQLTSDAPGVTPDELGGENTFVWSEGVVRLATILPDGTPVQGKVVARLATRPGYSNAVSDDGSKLFFTSGGALYMRVNPAKPQSALSGGECTEPAKACTYQVDESEGPGASGGGFFEFASADGSRVFFTSDHKMTPDSTAVAGKEDLYEYDTETHDLTDLTVDASEPADVWAISDASEDGSYVYFIAEAALEDSGATTPGSCARYEEGNTCNLYVRHNGENHYITALSVDDTPVFFGQRFLPSSYNGTDVQHHEGSTLLASESSPGGRFFAFDTTESLNGEGHGVYIYDADADQLSCVTCGEAEINPESRRNAGIQPQAQFGETQGSWRRNQVLDDGSVFFTTSAALVPADTNEAPDAYVYKDGQRHLISTGVVPGTTNFVDATPNGSDIYFVTPADILPVDQDGGGLTVYDARVNGGFPEPPPLPGCEGEACRGAGTSASTVGATGSASFKGAGNQGQHHKRDCGIAAKRAQKLARDAKRLRRLASGSKDPEQAKQLRQRSAKLAKQGRSLSKSAKRCRRANRGAGK